jgi:hypothetical protein
MTTQLYDREFAPFTIDGARRIVASEGEWRRVRAFARENVAARIRVPVDVFEPWDGPWDGPMTNGDGERLAVNRATWWEPYRADHRHGAEYRVFAKMQRVRDRLFDLIDECQHLRWTLETTHPENVAAMMSPVVCKTCRGSGYWETGPHSGPCDCDRKILVRPNLWLYAKVNTQAEADARIPHLLRVPAAVYGVVMESKELIRFGNVPGFNKCGSAGQELLRRFHVIIRGGAEPLHPDWVRSIIRQCEAAGVPVWFDGWGEYVEWDGSQSPSPACRSKDGLMPYVRVGAAHSGCVIDGREVKQLPEVTL